MIVSSKAFEREFIFYKEGVDKSYSQIVENLIKGYMDYKVNSNIYETSYKEFLQQQQINKQLLLNSINESLQKQFKLQKQKALEELKVQQTILNEQYEEVDRFKMKYSLKLWMLIVKVFKQNNQTSSTKLKEIYQLGNFSKQEILIKEKEIEMKENLLMKAKDENDQLQSLILGNTAIQQQIEENLKKIHEENQNLNQIIRNIQQDRNNIAEKLKFYELCFQRLLASLENRISFSKLDEILKEKFWEQIQLLNQAEDKIFRRNYEVIEQFQKGLLCLGKVQLVLSYENKSCQVTGGKDWELQIQFEDKDTQCNNLQDDLNYQKYKEKQLRVTIDSLQSEIYELKELIKKLNAKIEENHDSQSQTDAKKSSDNKGDTQQCILNPKLKLQSTQQPINESVHKTPDVLKNQRKQQRSRTQITEEEFTANENLQKVEEPNSKKIENDSNNYFSANEQPSDMIYPEMSTHLYPNENSDALNPQTDSDGQEKKQQSIDSNKNGRQQLARKFLQIDDLPSPRKISSKQQKFSQQFEGIKKNHKFEDFKLKFRKRSLDRSCQTTRAGQTLYKAFGKEQNLTFIKETRQQEIQNKNDEQFIFYDDYPSDFEAQCYIDKLLDDFEKRNKRIYNQKFNLLKQAKLKISQEANSESSQKKTDLPFLTYKSKLQWQQKMRLWVQKAQQINQNKLKLDNKQ